MAVGLMRQGGASHCFRNVRCNPQYWSAAPSGIHCETNRDKLLSLLRRTIVCVSKLPPHQRLGGRSTHKMAGLHAKVVTFTVLERAHSGCCFGSRGIGTSSLLATSCSRRSTRTNKTCDDLYLALGVATDASMDEIHRAFLKLAKQHHPDMVDSSTADSLQQPSSLDTFHRIQTAYAVLSDESQRRDYDWKILGIWRHTPSSRRPHLTENTVHRPNDGKETLRRREPRHTTEPLRYTPEELASMQRAEVVRELEYQQLCKERLRDMVKQREALRAKTYQEAWKYYQSCTEDVSLDSQNGVGFRTSSANKSTWNMKWIARLWSRYTRHHPRASHSSLTRRAFQSLSNLTRLTSWLSKLPNRNHHL